MLPVISRVSVVLPSKSERGNPYHCPDNNQEIWWHRLTSQAKHLWQADQECPYGRISFARDAPDFGANGKRSSALLFINTDDTRHPSISNISPLCAFLHLQQNSQSGMPQPVRGRLPEIFCKISGIYAFISAKEALQVLSFFSLMVIPISTPSICLVSGASASVSCSLEPVFHTFPE